MEFKTIGVYGVTALILLCIYLILDYFNIFSDITKNLNTDILNIIVNSIVVIFIFIITYKLVDKKTIEKEKISNENKLNTLNIMLQDVYNNCDTVINILDNDMILTKYIISKTDFNSIHNKVEDNLKNLPFKNETYIIGLFSDGIITKDIIYDYFHFKQLYQQYVWKKIAFFDVSIYNRKDVFDVLENEKKKLKEIIKNNLIKTENA